MRKIQTAFIFLSLVSIISCEEAKEDEVKDVDKNAAIETVLAVQHIDSADVLITKHKIWKDNKLVREIIKRDTIPTLGDTINVVEDKDGNEKTVKMKKDYEFYITVQ
ncbi:hypothetical protein ASG01_05690 [Chryseobacterium sp. Leaf180]|uniref:hypothetical protein n=1 Tax=Chryseobacterium sp. Leaf180 TaxID=1736289 RepID=UPI0006F4891F|nr:hypothetical protein [Chryseobacterium sp. Leaf180]KQR95338.1 hypothetical protein ASG01_05690 [Chryseobacterium sp. Leaf180]